MKTNNSNGQAYVEALVISFLFFVILSSIILLTYQSAAIYWLRQKVYESALCIVMKEPESSCRNHLTHQSENLFPFGKINQLTYRYKKNKSMQVHCTYTIAERWVYEIEHQIDLPLSTQH